jgi:FtsH-binding integral membrane protein
MASTPPQPEDAAATPPAQPAIEWSGGPPPPRPPRLATDFYRSQWRALVLCLLAPFVYWWWWLWQLFNLTRRESFPRARRFWWVLVPIYGWFVIYHQFQDLERESVKLGRPGTSPGLPIALLVASYVAADVFNRTEGTASLIAFLASSALTAASVYLVQRAANDYLKARYPQAEPRGLTWGETLATGLGVLVFGLEIIDWLVPSP